MKTVQTEKKALEVIETYVALKAEEKSAQCAVKDLNTAFQVSCEVLNNGSSQIQLPGGALVFKRFQVEYDYSDEINTLEDQLEALKEEYRKSNGASKIKSVWCVKL